MNKQGKRQQPTIAIGCSEIDHPCFKHTSIVTKFELNLKENIPMKPENVKINNLINQRQPV